MNMNVKKRSQESLTSKRKPMESWRQYQKLNQSAQKHFCYPLMVIPPKG